MGTLDVPGAKLNYQVTGSGPLLVLIPGARGDGNIFAPLAQRLASRFSVLSYDRRGCAGSRLDGPQDYSHRLETDADDVARLIRHAGDGPAVVFGSSSGALVALQVLALHPEVVGTLAAHEPPAMTLLPDSDHWLAFVQEIYDTYKATGMQPALEKFLTSMMSDSDREMLKQNAGRGDMTQMARDFDYWFEHELRQYPATVFDMGALQAGAGRTMFIAGVDTGELLPHRIAVLFAQKLGAPLHVLPGGHLGYVTRAEDFAGSLASKLAKHSADA